MLKIVVLAMALADVIVAQVKSPPAQWTDDPCANAGCVIGP